MANRILDYTQVQSSYRITMTENVRKILKVKENDLIAWVLDDKGNVLVRKPDVKV